MQRVKLIGELQSPIDPEPGCRFAKRCLYAREGCTGRDLALRDFGSGHFCACCRPAPWKSKPRPSDGQNHKEDLT